jgi:hypothetical protein
MVQESKRVERIPVFRYQAKNLPVMRTPFGGQAEIRALFLYRAHYHYWIFTCWHYEQGIFTNMTASPAWRPGSDDRDGWYHAAWRATDI